MNNVYKRQALTDQSASLKASTDRQVLDKAQMNEFGNKERFLSGSAATICVIASYLLVAARF